MRRVVFFLLSWALIACLDLSAAAPTGTIVGTVTDQSGAAIPNAQITVTSQETGFSRKGSSATDGGFLFPLLPVGIYNVSIETPGFQRFEQQGVEVRADSSVSVLASLQVGAISQQVTVHGNTALVETRNGTITGLVSESNIVDLPLNGRNAATLVLLQPGTVDVADRNESGDLSQPVTYPGSQFIVSNGAQAQGVNYLLDGGSNIDPYSNINNPFPNPDALEEFSVQTNNYNSEYGRAAGAIVNIVTKSGTNQLHGDGFEFLRNGAMNARNFFAPVSDKLKRNQFGGSIGGPIVKDKLFFFGNYQGTTVRNISEGNTAFVLTAAERAGDFSSLSTQLVDPVTKDPLPGNQLPYIDPVTSQLMPLIPTSNSPDGFLVYDRRIQQKENQFLGRVDYNLSSQQRIYGRYFYTRYEQPAIEGDTNLLLATIGNDFTNQSVTLNHTYTFSPTLLNQFLFAYNRNAGSTTTGAPFSLGDVGVNIASPSQPEIFLQIPDYFSISTGRYRNIIRQNYNFADSVHWIHGKHEFFFGGDFLRVRVDAKNLFRQSGQFRFRGTNFSGNPLADFMLGAVERFIQGGGEFIDRNGNNLGIFAQDNIRISRSLTVNLGLRWDPYIPYKSDLGHTECYRPGLQSTRFPNAPLGYLFAGDSGCPEGGTESTWALLSPRFGFAYNFGGSDRTVLRGGAGLFSQPPFLGAFNNFVDSAPWSPQFIFFGVPFDNPYQGTTNPFPDQFAPFTPPTDVSFQLPMVAVSYASGWKPMRLFSWNLTLQRQLRPTLIVSASYVGSKGTHTAFNVDQNAAPYGPGATPDNIQERRPNQDYQTINESISGGNSFYSALQLSVDKRLSYGLSLTANYTYGHCLDLQSYQSDLDGFNTINPFNVGAYRGSCDYNMPQRWTLNYVWLLPSPKENKFLQHLLGNWESSGIWTRQSGYPLTIYSGEDNALSGVGNDTADIVSRPGYTSGSRGERIAEWFTTNSFVPNAIGTFGNSGRNILRGPAHCLVDWSIMRNFPITERWKLQFRAEFFNFFNHPQLGDPGNSVTSSDFGRITSAGDPRIVQMALKLYF
jgi:Carboxypeptidase regulatory-like domain